MLMVTLAEHKHIMLSYSHGDSKEVLKIKDTLKEQGYKVWIDIEKIASGKFAIY